MGFISIFKFISDHLYYKITKDFFTYLFPNDNGDNLLTLSSPIFNKFTVTANEKYVSYSFLPIPGLQLDVRKHKTTVLKSANNEINCLLFTSRTHFLLCQIWGSHSIVSEDSALLVYNTVTSGKWFLKFSKKITPSSSRMKKKIKGNHPLSDTASHPRRPWKKTQVLITDSRPEPRVLTEINDFSL